MEFIVGTSLAVVPLIVEAYDHYKSLSAGIYMVQHYPDELRKLDTIVDTQKARFRRSAISLLQEITQDPTKAKTLLDKPDHSLKVLNLPFEDKTRLDNLKEQFRSWLDTSKQLSVSLDTICGKLQPLKQDADRNRLAKRLKLAWSKTDLQAAIAELREFTKELSDLTNELTADIRELRNPRSSASGSTSTPAVDRPNPPSHASDLSRIAQIQRASAHLYAIVAPRWNCVAHGSHSASISLVSQQDDSITKVQVVKENSKAAPVRFSVAIKPDSELPGASEDAVWLNAEIVRGANRDRLGYSLDPNGPLRMQGLATAIGDHHNASAEAAPEVNDSSWPALAELREMSQPFVAESKHKDRNPRKPVKKSRQSVESTGLCREAQATSQGHMQPSLAVQHLKTRTLDAVRLGPDASSAGASDVLVHKHEQTANACEHLPRARLSCGVCIRCIHDSAPDFVLSHEHSDTQCQETLAEIIERAAETGIFRSPRRSRAADIASKLALAILQYGSTPWLSQDWQSNQIIFFGTDSSSGKGKGKWKREDCRPYLNVRLPKPCVGYEGKGPLVSTPSTSSSGSSAIDASSNSDALSVSPTFASMTITEASSVSVNLASDLTARSELLFRFGIILLELAYGRPWSQLYQDAVKGKPRHRQTEDHAARILSKKGETIGLLGPLFPKAVQVCLGCAASYPDLMELSDEEWRTVFVNEVLVVLQRIHAALKTVNPAP